MVVIDVPASDGALIHAEVLGRGDGPPILVVPGGGLRDPAYLGDVAEWGSCRPLAVLHMRGTAKSPGTPAAWWNQSADIDAVRNALGLVDDLDVLGHSFGALVALAYAASRPVRRLGLITPPVPWLPASASDVPEMVEARLDQPEIVAALEAPEPDPTDPAAHAEHLRITAPLAYRRWDAAAKAHAGVGAADFNANRVFFGSPPPSELMQSVSALSIPVHVIAGGADLITGRRPVEALAAMFPAGTLETIADCGHYPWIDQPELFADAVGRWSREAG